MKKIISFVLAFVLLLASTIPASAADTPSAKEEVVYGLLGLDGSVNKLYVVNIFNGGEITDYGNYSDIRNMTTSENISKTGDKITLNTNADKFYYQGTLENKELPWDISIKYHLDDKEISGKDLAGKSGRLKIIVSVKQNNKINSTFFDNYALQIALSLDNKLCSGIKTENATVAEAGSKKQLSYTVLPGNSMDITVTADVRDFQMEAITINGIRLSLGINVDRNEFTGQISQLSDAIKGLDNGAGELSTGLNQLSVGMQKYIDGMKAFKDGIGQLSNGADKLNTGASALKNGLSELTKQNESLVNGALAIQQATFDSVNAKLTEMGLTPPVLTPENYSSILKNIPELAAVKQQLDGAIQFTQGLKGYTDGVAQLNDGASDLAKGAEEFKSSSSVIAASANELYNAGAEINTAIRKLRDGLATYRNGTEELRNGTSDMDSQIDNRIDEMLGSISGKGGKVISFVSDKNTNVSAVQFVLKTNAINTPKAQSATPTKPVKLSFWQKLLKLFGLNK
jgi:X-X-X-Leu-X-X-Gly heptad repeat protein